MGGAIGQQTSWRWAFWINLPICSICFLGLLWSMQQARSMNYQKKKFHQIDFIGMAVLTTSTISFLLGLTMGGTVFPWRSINILLPMILGSVGFVIFPLVEKRQKAPMIPLRIFRNGTAAAGLFSTFAHGLILWCVAYYLIVFVSACGTS
jgi:MFS family permease